MTETNAQHGHVKLTRKRVVSQRHRQRAVAWLPRARSQNKVGWLESFEQPVQSHGVKIALSVRGASFQDGDIVAGLCHHIGDVE